MYLLLLKQATDLGHVIAHVGKIALGVAFMVALLFALNKLAKRASKSGKSKKRHSGGYNRELRRQESRINRRRSK